jgi:hypothetical protein
MRVPLILALACVLPAASWAADDHDGKCRHGEFREKILAKFDTNHDGKLDDGERAAAKAAIQQHREERQELLKKNHPELFAKIDSNGDGKLERDEVKAFREAHGKGRHHGEKQN